MPIRPATAAVTAAALAAGLSSCDAPAPTTAPADAPEQLVAVVHGRYDFNADSFTQGLEIAPDGTLYVGTGVEGESRIYRRTLDGEEFASRDIPEFGEGITRVDGTVWQLTWKSGTAYQRDAATLEETARASYDGEGWGICYREDAGELLSSDGSAQLRRMDPATFEERERFDVTAAGEPVAMLNELECVGDDVYANVFTTTDIVRIDAATGAVTAIIDASGLDNNATSDPNHVLNGIAHIPGTANPPEFLVTGKRWPDMYRVTFEPATL